MTRQEQEQELLYIIRSHDDPAYALKTAVEIIIAFLKSSEQPETYPESSFEVPPASA